MLLIGGGIYLFINKNNSYNYSIEEEKWIEENKNNSIDIYMPSDIAGLTLSGEGLFFDFISYFQDNTGLKINPVAYQINSKLNSNFSISLVDEFSDNDINLFTDEYIVISKVAPTTDFVKNITQVKIGVLKSEQELISNYFGSDIQYEPFDTKELLVNALNSDILNSPYILDTDRQEILNASDVYEPVKNLRDFQKVVSLFFIFAACY